MDHAHALHHAAHRPAVRPHRDMLWPRVCGHDGASEVHSAVRRYSDRLNPSADAVHRQERPDDAGRGDHNLVRVNPELCAGELRHLDRILDPALADRTVRAPSIHHDRLCAPFLQVLHRYQERGALERVTCIHTRSYAGRLRVDQPHVELVPVGPDAGLGCPGKKPTRRCHRAFGYGLDTLGYYPRSLFHVPCPSHGYTAGASSPIVSGKPSITFMF